MMQPYSPLTFAPPGMLAPPGVHPLLAAAAGGRYSSEFLHQQFPMGSRLPEHISPSLSDRYKVILNNSSVISVIIN